MPRPPRAPALCSGPDGSGSQTQGPSGGRAAGAEAPWGGRGARIEPGAGAWGHAGSQAAMSERPRPHRPADRKGLCGWKPPPLPQIQSVLPLPCFPSPRPSMWRISSSVSHGVPRARVFRGRHRVRLEMEPHLCVRQNVPATPAPPPPPTPPGSCWGLLFGHGMSFPSPVEWRCGWPHHPGGGGEGAGLPGEVPCPSVRPCPAWVTQEHPFFLELIPLVLESPRGRSCQWPPSKWCCRPPASHPCPLMRLWSPVQVRRKLHRVP